ncbi:1-hydroxy-2-methyl-2-butenyl 4-diphosphate reductase [Streptomyces sp. NBC_00335]|uniref:phosphorylase family protein n=1 Tax=unclassified Streptomyces TaxID=2593676 RepID=UPI00225820DD|nr:MULTISPECIES: 1-hydroxy-2-methyl-2-butenyl 4-diphosphate reductase [unclassified Streptomyces]MCX5403383.1 1-hydroxy-2-methyl-2-butenyl 4-diphosphate reductase [Streptomyces sp. NBC_00086]
MTGGPATAAPPPLLIACALRIERTALRSTSYRGSRERGAPERYEVLRTGMGPRAAERAVGSKLAEPELRGAAVLATGFCAGLLPGMSPGDLIVAEETRDPRGTVACAGTALLAEALARAVPGRTVHLGALTGSDHVVRGQERAQLRAGGAIGVDMESAATLWTATRGGSAQGGADRPVAAVRVIVDAPEHELVRIGTVRGGISAFRVLRAVLPAFYEWHRSLLLPRR